MNLPKSGDTTGQKENYSGNIYYVFKGSVLRHFSSTLSVRWKYVQALTLQMQTWKVGRKKNWKDFGKLKKWHSNKMQSNKKKILQLGKSYSLHKERIRSNWIGKSSAEKDLGLVADHKLNRSQQGHTVMKKANITMGWIKRITVCRTFEVIFHSSQHQ